MMQNNTQTDKNTQKTGRSWVANLKNQLDIELPEKKKIKEFYGWFFIRGRLFAGYAFGLLIEMQPPIPEMSKQLLCVTVICS
ncbi:MAG: hypothetical protein IPO25_14875 [Saprospiraceae bacterium]|nr:hypothetical protein [Saprospiraceae bacterium]